MASGLQLLLALSGLFPMTAELDFSKMPAKGTGQDYELRVIIELDGNDSKEFALTLSGEADPDDALGSVQGALKQTGWDVKKDGQKLTFSTNGKQRVSRVTFVSDYPTPAVKWLPNKPKK